MTSPVTILLLDEEPMLRRATALLLSNRGGHVTPAATPDEAVALAMLQTYDVAVFDVSRAGPSAQDVLRRIRADGILPRRVIAVCDEPLDRRDEAEFARVLCKPYPFDHLISAVFGCVHGRRRGYLRASLRPRITPRGSKRVPRAVRGPG